MKLLLYCTKAMPYLAYDPFHKCFLEVDKEYAFNGKIVAECDCDLIEEIIYVSSLDDEYCMTNSLTPLELCKKTCLSENELAKYLSKRHLKKFDDLGYALHLSNVHVFDKPKELSEYWGNHEFKECCSGFIVHQRIKKAPQNMMYCFDDPSDEIVLISIRPEWLAKIIIGKKTIDVRNQILKEMKGLIK